MTEAFTPKFTEGEIIERCTHEWLEGDNEIRCRRCGESYVPISGVATSEQVFLDECSG